MALVGTRIQAAVIAGVTLVALGGAAGCSTAKGPTAAGSSSTASARTTPAPGGSGGPGTPAPTSSRTPSSPRSTSAQLVSAKGSKAVETANIAVTHALFDLVSTSKRLRSSQTLGQARRPVTDALAATRASLKAERTAAYGGTIRYCSRVWTAYDGIRRNAAATRTAQGRLLVQTAQLRQQVAQLDGKAAAVRAADEKLRAAVKQAKMPPSTVTESQVTSALQAATQLHAATLKSIASVEGAATAAVGKAQQSVNRGWVIVSRTC